MSLKNIIDSWWAPALTVVLLVSLNLFVVKNYVKEKHKATTLEATISDLNQEIKQTKIKLGDSIEVYQATVKNLTMTADNLSDRYNRLLKASKVKAKDVSSVTEIVSVVHLTDTVYAAKDSIGDIRIEWSDSFLNLDLQLKPDLSTIIQYELRDSLTVINVQKKHRWLFGLIKWNEHKETRVINRNPNATIEDLKTIDIFE